MTIVTHALATTLGVRVFKLTGSDAVLAYVFGVGVDLDHAIKAPFYLRAVGRHRQSRIDRTIALLPRIPATLS